MKRLGGFFFHNATKPWNELEINQSEAFLAQTSGVHLPGPDGPTIDPDDSISINVFEVQAILLAFQLFASQWCHRKVIIYTDSTTALSGLKSHRFRGLPNVPLRQIMLIAAEHDILLEPRWLEPKANGLADALSCFNGDAIANLCLRWQNPLALMLHLNPRCSPSEAYTQLKPCSGLDSLQIQEKATSQLSDPTSITPNTLEPQRGPPPPTS